MSDKPAVGDLVWVRPKCSDLEEDWYLTEYPWDDDGLDVTPFKPTEVVQIKRMMAAFACILIEGNEAAKKIAKDVLDYLSAEGRVTIEREGKG